MIKILFLTLLLSLFSGQSYACICYASDEGDIEFIKNAAFVGEVRFIKYQRDLRPNSLSSFPRWEYFLVKGDTSIFIKKTAIFEVVKPYTAYPDKFIYFVDDDPIPYPDGPLRTGCGSFPLKFNFEPNKTVVEIFTYNEDRKTYIPLDVDPFCLGDKESLILKAREIFKEKVQ